MNIYYICNGNLMLIGIIVYYNIFLKNNLNFFFYLFCINGYFLLIGLIGLDDFVFLNEIFFLFIIIIFFYKKWIVLYNLILNIF